MRFITVRDFRARPGAIWKDLSREQEMVITSNGKPIAMLTPVSDRNLDVTLSQMRRVKAATAISALQGRSVRAGTHRMRLAEINRQIDQARKGIHG